MENCNQKIKENKGLKVSEPYFVHNGVTINMAEIVLAAGESVRRSPAAVFASRLVTYFKESTAQMFTDVLCELAVKRGDISGYGGTDNVLDARICNGMKYPDGGGCRFQNIIQ